mgnify:CR=1 FL=1
MTQTMRYEDQKFDLGRVLMTRGVSALVATGLNIIPLIRRHATGDWGQVPKDDRKRNEHAIEDGERIMSAYETDHGPIWVITERDRSRTTALLPREY